MSATTVSLLKDFSDFYDNEFENYSCADTSLIDRRSLSDMDKPSQLAYLAKAGLDTPIFGSPNTAIVEYEAKFHYLLNMFDMQHEISFIHYQKDGDKRLITLAQANQLDDDAFLVEHIPMAPENNRTRVLSYSQFGSLYCWTVRTGYGHYRLKKCSDVKVELLNNNKVGALSPHYLQHFSSPLFSIDFLTCGTMNYAIGYSASPNLCELGVEKQFSAKEVAKSLFLSIKKEDKAVEIDSLD